MTEPIRWTVEEVRAVLGDYGRAPRGLNVEALESWWFNLVLRVEADGERLILRRYGITPPEEVQWELALLAHVRGHGFPTIEPLRRDDGGRLSELSGRPAILYQYVEGSNACGPEVDRPGAMTETAGLIGRLNRLTRDLSLPHPRVRSGADPRRALRNMREWVAERGIRPGETRLAELMGHVDRAADAFEARLAPYAAMLPRGVVHHDAHCANVLFHEGRLVALIDFDDAFEGYLVAELPVMLSNWAGSRETFALDPGQVMAILRAYHRERPLTAEERELLPAFHLLYNLADTVVDVYEGVRRGGAPEEVIAEWSGGVRAGGYPRFRHYLSDSGWREVLERAVEAL